MGNTLAVNQDYTTNNKPEKKETFNNKNARNYGIDLLRIVSMFFVVILHCLGQGGILNSLEINSIQYKFAWFIEICAYCAVNIFALISGYVSYTDKEKEIKYSNYINIWLQIVFYGLIVTILFDIINPTLVSNKDYLIVLLPFANSLYWYFSAYTGLFAIIPFLNNGIRSCSTKTMKRMFILIIILFSIINIITNNLALNGGYSFVWLVLLYILGATIKKCNIGKNLKNYKCIIAIVCLCFITYLYKIYGLEESIFNLRINKNLLVSYTSPTILGVAILYLIIFSKIKFNSFLKKIIKFAAPSAFTVYILNNHRLIWDYVMKNLFINITDQSIIKIFIFITVFSSLFVIFSILIDKIRILLFKKIHIKIFIDKVDNLLNILLTKLEKLI